jgi:hypothetical protein
MPACILSAIKPFSDVPRKSNGLWDTYDLGFREILAACGEAKVKRGSVPLARHGT